MTLKIIILSIGFFIGLASFEQKTSYFKDQDLSKEVSQNSAEFKKVEFNEADTLVNQIIKISDNVLLSESKWINNTVVGVWTKYNWNGDLISRRDFGVVVYANDLKKDSTQKLGMY